jgi:hypothetical protein
VSNEAGAIRESLRKVALDEASKVPLQLDLWRHGVAGLLETQSQVSFDATGLEHGALPVALLHSDGLKKSDGLDTERRGGLKDAADELGSRQGQDQVDG